LANLLFLVRQQEQVAKAFLKALKVLFFTASILQRNDTCPLFVSRHLPHNVFKDDQSSEVKDTENGLEFLSILPLPYTYTPTYIYTCISGCAHQFGR
jgi:hypothetical protein